MSKQFKNDDFDRLYLLMMREFAKVNTKIDGVQEDVNNMKKTLDYLVGEYNTLTDEQTAIAGAHVRIDDTLDDHEKRISELELQQAA